MTRSRTNRARVDTEIPRLFGKASGMAASPNKTKKNGGGRGNWGREGDELLDQIDMVNLSKPRRQSNSSMYAALATIRTKFEDVEDEPVFIESLHGNRPSDISDAGDSMSEADSMDHLDLGEQSELDTPMSVGSMRIPTGDM